MSFDSYKGSTKLGSGLTPLGGAGFALMQACDIQVDEDGKRLDTRLDELTRSVEGVDLSSEITEQYDLVEQIKTALEEKAEDNNNPSASCSFPEPTDEDEGKVLGVVNGEAEWVTLTLSDEGDVKPTVGGGSTSTTKTFVDVTYLPEYTVNENVLYRYTEQIDRFYAVTTTSRNIAYVDGKNMTVNVIDVDTLPSYNSAEPVSDLSKTITLYYQYSDGKVYGAINNILLMAAAKVSEQGWYEPTYIISNYAGVIDNVLDAEYGYVYVVHEVETKIHILYFKDGAWHETVDDYVPRLGEVSKAKFESTPDENINVSGYRSITNNYDRVYVESAGNTGVSGDYCLTPDAEVLPTNPWVAASEDKVERLPSIPVRNENGEISVYTDDESTPDKAVSKRYFNRNTVQYVRRKPEESSAVANAKVVSAHTWTPDDSLYQKYAETFDVAKTIPTVDKLTDDDLIAIFSESNANNGILIDSGDKVVECYHLTSAQSKYRFIRKGTENELVLSFDIYMHPASDLVNNRGFTMVAKNDILADTSIWGGSNVIVEYPKGGSGYTITFLSQKVPFDCVDKWVNIRIEMDGLGKGSEARLYLDNVLKISGTLTESVASIKAYDFMILNWNNSNSGFRGYIYFDNMYFGDIPDTVRYSGFDTLTPIAYDYEDERVKGLGLDTIVTRKPDGSMLTKKELTDEDDERSAVSKYHFDHGVYITKATTLSDRKEGNTYYVTIPGIENLDWGMSFSCIFDESNDDASEKTQICINNKFYYSVVRQIIEKEPSEVYDKVPVEPNLLQPDKPYRFAFDGEALILVDYPIYHTYNLPQIRFVKFEDVNGTCCAGNQNTFKFTVEIMGGGELRAGDKLQLCVRRTSWYRYKVPQPHQSLFYKKQKLRVRAQHEITEEDTSKRFITLEMDAGDDNIQDLKFFFYNDRGSSLALSPIYFRIKRVTRYGSDGMECDSISSNVVTVWKTYNREIYKLSIK